MRKRCATIEGFSKLAAFCSRCLGRRAMATLLLRWSVGPNVVILLWCICHASQTTHQKRLPFVYVFMYVYIQKRLANGRMHIYVYAFIYIINIYIYL